MTAWLKFYGANTGHRPVCRVTESRDAGDKVFLLSHDRMSRENSKARVDAGSGMVFVEFHGPTEEDLLVVKSAKIVRTFRHYFQGKHSKWDGKPRGSIF